MLLILLTVAPALAGEASSAPGYMDQSIAMAKKFGIEALSFIAGIVALVWFATTPLGFFVFGVAFVANTYKALGFGWAIVSYFVVYALVAGIGTAIIARLARSRAGGDSPPRRQNRHRPEAKSSGPIGGSHAAEAMILDKHYEDPLARHGARYIRDKLLG
ncbi:hypothetical protein [Magnetospirillum moscoviense]|nr:hypothetical protein [Magnetospirillum moscoviense]